MFSLKEDFFLRNLNRFNRTKTTTPEYNTIPAKVIEEAIATGNKEIKTEFKNLNMLIKVNGESKFIPQNTSILKLLETLNINKDRVVIELNKQILNKSSFSDLILKENDELEVVTFVGGG